MIAKTQQLSAGILLYRFANGSCEVLLGHMGGPYWERKDEAAWSIPKGEYGEGEDAFTVACREFEEELGSKVPAKEFRDLGTAVQASGKVVTVWAAQGDFDASSARSNTFAMEWPKGSGTVQEFPEIDRAAWYDIETARSKLVRGQRPFLDRLLAGLS
ncbi:MAG TPA: NUDIX domain-containing protein [Candidatus Sulfotelmatobacter sp.]|jgi:predicted NUDIX family NTP pyrophosphohydrolase|nr:NUDIX domain-containing protein [Candidatus Sulfotelmatobacter sp.]